ncbi:phage tail protein [Methylobacter sp.]|uniref:phage tail protein n=1 Tax=Methylobacter sp. TaxID=2051955 RepID=UPI003DA2BB6D
MKKIADLHAFILSLDLVAAEQIDSYVDDLVIVPSGRPAPTAGQIIIAEKRYTATFNIERYPHGQISEDALLAQIAAWLIENDTTRTDPIEFPLIVDVHDAQTANLEFGITFEEWILAAEDVAGPITANGKQYALV